MWDGGFLWIYDLFADANKRVDSVVVQSLGSRFISALLTVPQFLCTVIMVPPLLNSCHTFALDFTVID